MNRHDYRYRVFEIYILGMLLLMGQLAARCQRRTSALEQGKRVVQPFDYRGVVLEEGPLKRQFDEVRFDYLRIPPDALLKGFRKRAGLPAPGIDLGGWYSSDTFHVFGQILSGLARMYGATGDPACKISCRDAAGGMGKVYRAGWVLLLFQHA